MNGGRSSPSYVLLVDFIIDDSSISFQDSGVVVSEASQGSIEVLDKSTTSQWSGSEENAPECRVDTGDATEPDSRWDDKQPDSMTPDEAEILLSSRYTSCELKLSTLFSTICWADPVFCL